VRRGRGSRFGVVATHRAAFARGRVRDQHRRPFAESGHQVKQTEARTLGQRRSRSRGGRGGRLGRLLFGRLSGTRRRRWRWLLLARLSAVGGRGDATAAVVAGTVSVGVHVVAEQREQPADAFAATLFATRRGRGRRR